MKELFLIITLFSGPYGYSNNFIKVASLDDCHKRGKAAVELLTDVQFPDNSWKRYIARSVFYECVE